MLIYFFYFLFALIGVFFVLGKENSWRNLAFFCISTIFVGFISGIRWKTGTDWYPYYNLFFAGESLSDYIDYYHFELGFKFLNWFFNALSNNYTFFLTATSLFVFASKFFTVYKRPYAPLFIVALLGVSLGDLFSVRQSIAISLGFLAIFYLSKGRFFIYMVLVLFAFAIHKTAIILLAAYLLIKLRFYYLVLTSIFLSFSLIFLLPLAFDLLGILFPGGYVNYQIEVYLLASEGRFSLQAILYKLIFLLFFMYSYFYVRKHLSKFELYALKLYAFSLPLSVFIDLEYNMFTRLVSFFSIFEIVVVPLFIYYYFLLRADFALRLLVMLAFFFFYFLRFYSLLLPYWDLYMPYETIFHTHFKEVY